MPEPSASLDEHSFRAQILEAARIQVRRFGEAKTNVVDIARGLGTSHTTIYRHFRSKADIFDALVVEAMRDEEDMARRFVETDGPIAERLEGMVLALHARKRDRFATDPEVYGLYRRIVEERPEIIAAYAVAMTTLIARILADGRRRGEVRIDDVEAAAGVVRDAVTVFVHPAHVAAAVAAGLPSEKMARNVVRTLCAAFRAGIDLD
ncbi:TetR/AcrR family transcriptional regulator [Bradyrhizobium sp. AUGA SZCCT0431]|uniref:TetR/AcrR family transcriptional regulator n=1 Tax=Bradyrhizobium sp. AUGA SZCCT0431 TaxID=2807674 RepID=UPI001BA55C6C|nr:TetR family transcriptional regulator [Bradyrhizobium sp. AUGA SZCCT0431]MBR1147552.1 TetR family transcriptional regulator [Bradyrhizobium sp. AUGA SZCCT0431]